MNGGSTPRASTSSTSRPPSPDKPPKFDARTATDAEYQAEKVRRFGPKGDYVPKPEREI